MVAALFLSRDLALGPAKFTNLLFTTMCGLVIEIFPRSNRTLVSSTHECFQTIAVQMLDGEAAG
jgi:hypothetical protein